MTAKSLDEPEGSILRAAVQLCWDDRDRGHGVELLEELEPV